MTSDYNFEHLNDLLPVYYKRLFPYKTFYRWLSYGNLDKNYFPYREFSFTLEGDIYLRYQSFGNAEEFEKEMQKRCPQKIDIGAVFTFRPKDHRAVSNFQAVEKELVFDIDMSDYDDVRYCCNEAKICKKCWPLMTLAIEILHKALRDDFGFKHILWVYSGRRGIHCWICDETARKLTVIARSAIADYLTLVIGGENIKKKVNLGEVLHPSVQRAVEIISSKFDDIQVRKQDFLSTKDRWKKVLELIPDPQMRATLESEMGKRQNSAERWKAIKDAINLASSKKLKNTVAEIMLQLCYPRLDINVTKGLNHLLKSPFSIHPKSGCVCVPIDLNNIETFNPFVVPVISKLVGEINVHDAQMKDACSPAIDNQAKKRVKDYKKTSLTQSITVFKDFVKELESTWSGKLLEKSDMKREF